MIPPMTIVEPSDAVDSAVCDVSEDWLLS